MLRSWLALALLLHVVLATSYAWRTPDFEGPDENSHYEYAQHVANSGKLPLAPALAQARGLPQTEGAVLAHHPPLYYALLAAVLVATGRDDTVFGPLLHDGFGDPASPGRHLRFRHSRGVDGTLFLLRLVSVALGALSLVLVHRLGRACCPQTPRIADLAVLLVACLPMWSFLHGVLNNDVLAITLATATVLALVRFVQKEDPGRRDAAGIALLLGLSLLAKLTTLFLLPLALAAAVPVTVRRLRDGQVITVVADACLVAVLLLAVCGWMLLRNHLLYGDALGTSVHDASFPPIAEAYRWPVFRDVFLPSVFASLLGCFGWFALPPHPALQWAGAAVAALALGGLLRRTCDREAVFARHTAWSCALALALVFAGVAHFNWSHPQPQGRLLLPAAGPAAVLLAAGLLRATVALRWRRRLLPLLPLTAAVVFLAWFRPAFAIDLAEAPAWHRALVGGIVAPRGETAITWREAPASPSATPPTLRWSDPGAPPDTRYALYAYDGRGRVWLATHEWAHGAMVVQGNEVAVPAAAMGMLPVGVDVSFRLRRVPRTAAEDPATLPVSPPLPFRRQ